jgi:drug/metabolite transporter (DMT)-like permease
MVLAQLCFAAMNVFTRLGSRHLPWPEIAAARFLVSALIAVGLAAARGKSLAVTDRGGTWQRSIYGTISALGTFFALSSPRVAIGDAATLGRHGRRLLLRAGHDLAPPHRPRREP